MKHETIAARLAEAVQRKKHLSEVIARAESKYQDEINGLLQKVEKLQGKQLNVKKKEREEFASLQSEEKNLRAALADAPIGANWATEHGKVTIQGRDVPKVTNLKAIPLEFRKPPEQCILTPKIKAALKSGQTVPGFRWDKAPTVVVR